jgi:hypothetical protein
MLTDLFRRITIVDVIGAGSSEENPLEHSRYDGVRLVYSDRKDVPAVEHEQRCHARIAA